MDRELDPVKKPVKFYELHGPHKEFVNEENVPLPVMILNPSDGPRIQIFMLHKLSAIILGRLSVLENGNHVWIGEIEGYRATFYSRQTYEVVRNVCVEQYIDGQWLNIPIYDTLPALALTPSPRPQCNNQ